MKKTVALFAMVLALAGMTAGEAKAARQDFTSSTNFVDMANVTTGMYGIINSAPYGEPEYGVTFDHVLTGTLAAKTFVVFSYKLSEAFSGTYDFGNVFPTTSIPGVVYVKKEQVDDSLFQVMISNLRTIPLSFRSALTLTGYQGDVMTSYTTVPLPAALPLFGLGLVGLAGYKRMKKKAA